MAKMARQYGRTVGEFGGSARLTTVGPADIGRNVESMKARQRAEREIDRTSKRRRARHNHGDRRVYVTIRDAKYFDGGAIVA